MGFWKNKCLVLILAAALVIVAALPASAEEQAWSKEPTAAAMIADFVIVRPLGIVACAVGSAFFVVSLPFSAAGGNIKGVYQKLVAEPAKFTFARPLGDVD